jgi:hypothetical protein
MAGTRSYYCLTLLCTRRCPMRASFEMPARVFDRELIDVRAEEATRRASVTRSIGRRWAHADPADTPALRS